MKKNRILLLPLIYIATSILAAGCWNYREIDKLSIVAGIAIDKGTNEKYKLTIEIIQLSGGKETKITPKILTTEGKSLFDAVRNCISTSGKRLYWSHTKVIILSREIANEGITNVIEWYNRDTETREEVSILISQEGSAKEILTGEATTEKITSFTLGEVLENQASLSKAPLIDLLIYDIESQTEGISTIIPAVSLMQEDDKKTPQILGTAIIKNDVLAGFLNGDETKYLLFIRDEIKSGILLAEMQRENESFTVSLEIFKSKTKVKPIVNDKEIIMNIDIKTKVAIDEINGTVNFLDEEGIKKLERIAGDTLKKQIESLIKKIQTEYDADILKFGSILYENDPQTFKRLRNNWNEVFKDLKTNVKTEVQVQNSAILSDVIGESE
jgi:spore germination protein KC